MSNIRSFNRFELKYIVPVNLIPILQEHLKQYMIPDSYGDKHGWYGLASLYYDNAEYNYYREKIEWLKYRRKLRIRCYERKEKLTPDSIVFVEIKQRVDRVTQKRRVPMKYSDALDLCNKKIIPHHEIQDAAVIDEIYQMVAVWNLRPTIITSYFRQAWMGTEYDLWLRITFDVNIRERHKDLDLESKKIWQFMIEPNYSIMEIKANEHIPFWIIELISKYNLNLIRISKYCQGLETSEKVNKSIYHIH